MTFLVYSSIGVSESCGPGVVNSIVRLVALSVMTRSASSSLSLIGSGSSSGGCVGVVMLFVMFSVALSVSLISSVMFSVMLMVSLISGSSGSCFGCGNVGSFDCYFGADF